MSVYEEILEAAIRKMRSIVKDVAIREARQVECLEVDEDGNVTAIEDEPEGIFEDLLDRYEKLSGDVALNLIATEIKQRFDLEPSDITLPERIRDRM